MISSWLYIKDGDKWEGGGIFGKVKIEGWRGVEIAIYEDEEERGDPLNQ